MWFDSTGKSHSKTQHEEETTKINTTAATNKRSRCLRKGCRCLVLDIIYRVDSTLCNISSTVCFIVIVHCHCPRLFLLCKHRIFKICWHLVNNITSIGTLLQRSVCASLSLSSRGARRQCTTKSLILSHAYTQ